MVSAKQITKQRFEAKAGIHHQLLVVVPVQAFNKNRQKQTADESQFRRFVLLS